MSINESAPINASINIEPGSSEPQPFPLQGTSDQPPPPQVIDPDNPPWGVLSSLIIWVTSIVLLIVVPIFLIIPYVVYEVSKHRSTANLQANPTLIFLSILGVLPAHALTFLLVWYVVTERGRRPFFRTLGWFWPRNFGPWKTVGLAILLFGAGWLITHFLGGPETQLDQIIKSSYKARFITAILAAATGPFIEELIYRGLLYSALQRVIGVIAAVVIVSVLFTAVHVVQYFSNFGVIAVIGLLSLVLTVVRAKTRSLLPSYVIHLVFNGVQAVLLMLAPFLEKSTPKPTTGLLLQTLSRLFG